MKCKLIEPPGNGEIIEHPEAHLLCEMGIAEPADEECQKMADAAIERNAQQQRRVEAQRRARAEEALARRQAAFGQMIGVETTDDVRAKTSEKRGQQ